jgi:hypothetical protein
MRRSYFHSEFRYHIPLACVLLACIWLYLHILIAITLQDLWLITTAAVLQPVIVLVGCAVLVTVLISLLNRITISWSFKELMQYVEGADIQCLDKDAKERLVKAMKHPSFYQNIVTAIHDGAKGIVVGKKTDEKLTKGSSKLSLKPYDTHRPHSLSGYNRTTDTSLPRKIILEFGDKSPKSFFSGGSGDYNHMFFRMHILRKKKQRNGEKYAIRSKNQSNEQQETHHPHATSRGGSKTCHVTETLDGSAQTHYAGVALQDNNELHRYSFEKFHGASLGAYLCRRLKERAVGANHKTQAVTGDAVCSMLEQCCKQLKSIHNQGACHGDIKMENICFNGKRGYTLIDFPEENELLYTAMSSILSSGHDFFKKVIKGEEIMVCSDRAKHEKVSSTVSKEQFDELEELLVQFEGNRPRRVYGKPDTPQNPPSTNYYLGVTSKTKYHDTFALMYVAYVMCHIDNDCAHGRDILFEKMRDMAKDYMEIYKNLAGNSQVSGLDRKIRASIIANMNNRWPLEDTIRSVAAALNPRTKAHHVNQPSVFGKK